MASVVLENTGQRHLKDLSQEYLKEKRREVWADRQEARIVPQTTGRGTLELIGEKVEEIRDKNKLLSL